jgi:hypothetical protein
MVGSLSLVRTERRVSNRVSPLVILSSIIQAENRLENLDWFSAIFLIPALHWFVPCSLDSLIFLEKIPPNFDITKLKEKALFVTLGGMGHGLRSGSEHSGRRGCMYIETWIESWDLD